MNLSRKEFLNLAAGLIGGWALTWPKRSGISGLAQRISEINEFGERLQRLGSEDLEAYDREQDPGTPSRAGTKITEPELEKVGSFPDISSKYFVFDENKYSTPKRKLPRSEWTATNRHLPIKIAPEVVNKPGQRSPQALQRVVEYTQFQTPRYVAAPGERASMCNIAAWDWSRALQLHLPHWIGETEMSANMLFRWVSHPRAGGVFGEGWQPVNAEAARLLANRGIPVFALVENTHPRRHGHVAMVYPKNMVTAGQEDGDLFFATVTNGRSRGGNGIRSLESTFRSLKPTYFVHKFDFIVHQEP
ncbi:MAG: hypothetical protein ACK2UE_03385 [Anaerolineales bacterium]